MIAERELKRNVRQAIPFFGVSSMENSLRFYVDGLGFKMTKNWIVEGKVRWCWLELDEAALMLQEHRGKEPNSWELLGKVGTGVSICFQCEDALAFYREVKSRGIVTQRPFVGNAMWVVNIADPDGYSLSFESLTDVPEETELLETE
jgi:catechol 2,3-dioxygenase-like lactoylglutathione lyase family enzyme